MIGELATIAPDVQPAYRVSLTIAVTDPEALWFAAFIKGLGGSDGAVTDITDVIGPAADPSIRDCIAMLAMPGAIPGCHFDDFWIDSVPCPKPSAALSGPGSSAPRGPRASAAAPVLRLAISN
jgi:hypothetical protein